MGQNLPKTDCYNRYSGENYNSGDSKQPESGAGTGTGSGGEAQDKGTSTNPSGSTCGCPVPSPTTTTPSNPPNACSYDGIPGNTPDTTSAGAKDALAAAANFDGNFAVAPSQTTKVTADVFQNANDVYGVETVGGRQRLIVQNGALDLRWYLNQGYDTDLYGKVPFSGTTLFYPAGNGGTFGFLKWLQHVSGFSTDRQNQFVSGSGGFTRDMVGTNDVPLDPGNQFQYNTKQGIYYKYDTQKLTYFWYNTGDLGTQDPRYLSTTTNRRGYSLYYNYSNSALVNITGDIGQLIPYFGYDSGKHINAIYLQDSVGSDHRTSYYYYDGSGGLSTIVDPLGMATYFQVTTNPGANVGYKVSKEVDPSGYTTYLSYDSGNNYRLLNASQAGRVTYFQDDGLTNGGRSSGNVPDGATRFYRRAQFAAHGFGVTDELIGGGLSYYVYNAPNAQLSAKYDANNNLTQFSVNPVHFRTSIVLADGAATYFGYAANNIDVLVKVGPRNNSLSQVTYYGYATGVAGQRVKILDATNNAVYFGYDSRTRLTQTLDARGGATYYFYDTFSRNTVVSDALGNSAYFAFNANAQKTGVQDALGNTTYYSFDKLDQRLSAQLPTGELTTWLRDPRGLISAEGRPGGRATYFAFDAFKNRTIAAQLYEGNNLSSTYFTFDDQSNVTSQRDPNGNLTQNGYDFRKRIVLSKDAAGNSTYFAFDPVGNRTHARNGNGIWTQSVYDSLNRQTTIARGVAGLHPPDQASIKGHWNMNESSGSRSDDSGNGGTLTPSGLGLTSQPGIINGSAQFVRANSNKLTGGTLTLTPDLTMAAWINMTTLPTTPASGFTYRPVVARWGASGFYSYSMGILRGSDGVVHLCQLISTNGTGWSFFLCTPLNTLTTGSWRHISTTFKASTGRMQFYVDGELVFTGNSAETAINNPGIMTLFTVGAHANMAAVGTLVLEYFDGLIDEVYVFNKVISQQSMSRLVQQRVDVSFTSDPSSVLSSYFSYDLDGNRSSVTDENGNTTYYGFDGLNRLITSKDPLANSLYYAYDANNNQIKVLNKRNFSTYYGYDLLSRLARAQDPLLESTYYGYDAVGNRISVLYPNLNSQYYKYDGSNRLISQIDQAGFVSYYGFDIAGNRSRVQDPRGFVTYYGFDLRDRPAAIQDGVGTLAYYRYDAVGNRIASLESVSVSGSSAGVYGGNPAYFGYDPLNRLGQQMDALLRASYFGYDSVGNQIRVSRPGSPVRTSYFGYDQFNRAVQSLDPTGKAAYFGYDRASNRIQILNPRSFASYFGFDALKRVVQTLDANTGASYFVYDANGNATQTRDVRGFWTYFAYDALDRLTQTTDANGGIAQRGFDLAGNLATLKPPSGNAAYYYYEPRNLLAVSVDGAGDTTYYGYDQSGNRAKSVTPRGFASYFGYDGVNRLTKILNAVNGVTYFGYDAAGNTASTVDPLNRLTRFYYDPLYRIVQVQDALLNSVYFGYDLAGNRNVEQDARSNSTYYRYDLNERLAAVLDPLGNSAYYGYDANSNLAVTLDNNKTVIYFGYDPLDRRTAIQYPAENQYFLYDAGGNLTATKDNWGASYFGYDPLSRLVARGTPRMDFVYYAYDASSNLTRLQYPQDFKVCYYGHDGAQRMIQAQSPAGNSTYWSYDPDSDVAKKIHGNGMVSWASFDNADRTISLRYATSTGIPITYFDYRRDVSGRINVINREPAAGYAIYYSYDNVDRLLQETWRKQLDNSQVYAFSYSYDAAGNRLQMRRESTLNTETESAYYSYAADNSLIKRFVQPSSASTYWYYDANGNASVINDTAVGATYFGYGAHQLVTAILPPPGVEAPSYFYYDSRLNRYCENRAGMITYFLWDGMRLLEERNGDGSLKVRYTHGYTQKSGIGSTIEAQRIAGGITYFQYLCTDDRGSVFAVTDQNQNTQLNYTMDAYGRQLASVGGLTPALPNELIYQSNWRTPKIGGQFYYESPTRFGDLSTGRFLGRDLIPNLLRLSAFPGGNVLGIFEQTKFANLLLRFASGFMARGSFWNLYEYISSVPNAVDSTGLYPASGIGRDPAPGAPYCGPDISDWLVGELGIFERAAQDARDRYDEVREAGEIGEPSIGAMGITTADLALTLARLALKQDYKERKFSDKDCQGCPGTVTVCGTCYLTSQIGNFMFGIIAQILQLQDSGRQYGRQQGPVAWAAGMLGKTGPSLPWTAAPWKEAAYNVGLNYEEMVRKNDVSISSSNFCKIFGSTVGTTSVRTPGIDYGCACEPCGNKYDGPHTDLTTPPLVDQSGNSPKAGK